FSLRVFDAGDGGTGVFYAFRGLGALIGPFLARPFVRDLPTMFRAIGASIGIYGVFYAVFPFAPTLWTAAPLVLLAHLGGGAQWMMTTYGLQRIVPDRLRGRVFSFDFGLVTLTIAMSNLAAGWAAGFLDLAVVMWSLAGISLAYAGAWTAATTGIRRRERERSGA
ncbi:MAG TPA: MFS transporter, partial [Actinomycetota bacterium]|nr:MFS transporter [Actinomycetota bacterium]